MLAGECERASGCKPPMPWSERGWAPTRAKLEWPGPTCRALTCRTGHCSFVTDGDSSTSALQARSADLGGLFRWSGPGSARPYSGVLFMRTSESAQVLLLDGARGGRLSDGYVEVPHVTGVGKVPSLTMPILSRIRADRVLAGSTMATTRSGRSARAQSRHAWAASAASPCPQLARASR